MQRIVIHEVGPRDGLQLEKAPPPTDQKEEWIRLSMAAGVDIVQVGSFVRPEKVPQMADTDELFCRLARDQGAGGVAVGVRWRVRGSGTTGTRSGNGARVSRGRVTERQPGRHRGARQSRAGGAT